MDRQLPSCNSCTPAVDCLWDLIDLIDLKSLRPNKGRLPVLKQDWLTIVVLAHLMAFQVVVGRDVGQPVRGVGGYHRIDSTIVVPEKLEIAVVR